MQAYFRVIAMKFNRIFKTLLISSIVFFAACSGGGGDDSDSSNDLGTGACSTLGLQTRIINGSSCTEQGSPVVELTLIADNGVASLCTGTMITSTDVLTAGHCAVGMTSAYITVGGTRVNAAQVAIHPGYSSQPSAVFNDVAVYRLSSAVSLPTVPLLISRDVQVSDTIQIFGYGQTENQSDNNDTSGTLRAGEMRVDNVTADHLFTVFNGDGSNTCFGDSGGPALLTSGASAGIVGVTSTGQREDCGEGDISLFANIQGQSVFDFIIAVSPGAGVI